MAGNAPEMKPKVYCFLGDGGYMFSLGFSQLADRLAGLGCDVQKFADSGRDVNRVAADIAKHNRPIIFMGYSLGANGCAWNAQTERQIDLLIGVDPTRNGPSLKNYPISDNVKRCTQFKLA